MYDRLENGRTVRILNVIDDYNRQALLCEPGFGFSSERVVDLFEQLIEYYGKPASIRTDNGTEFIAKTFELFCISNKHWVAFVPLRDPKNSKMSTFPICL